MCVNLVLTRLTPHQGHYLDTRARAGEVKERGSLQERERETWGKEKGGTERVSRGEGFRSLHRLR
jgi:hypothetical protein